MNLINKRIYLILSSVRTGFRAPSLIAENTGYSYRAILKTLKELKEMGLIQEKENHRYNITSSGIIINDLMIKIAQELICK